jgi:hypothetical protein
MAIIDIYKELDDEQRIEVEQLPRAERLSHIAALRQMSTKQLLEEVASETGLPLIENIELIQNPTWSLPLRLIHAYQCVCHNGAYGVTIHIRFIKENICICHRFSVTQPACQYQR